MFVLVAQVPSLLSFPSAPTLKLPQYNEKDTDEVISRIEKYVGKVSTKLILDNLKNRLPEARNNHLNIERITDYLLETFKDDESALFEINQLKEYWLSNVKKITGTTSKDFAYYKEYNQKP
jgi:hypothetical protein